MAATAPTGRAEPVLARAGLSFDGVTHSFAQRRTGITRVLDDVSFEVRPGEFVCVMGPSGCGKSTLLSMAAGFIGADEGSISWRGRAITDAGPDRGVVFQKPELYPWLDVWGNILFGPRAMGADLRSAEADARRLVGEVGLDGFEHHRPYELSGGMQHRVALARTLVNGPEMLLMDEPFAALDAQTRLGMQALLLDVWERHQRTVMFVTHDIEEGLLLADRIVVLSSRPGRVREILPVDFPRPRRPDLVFEPDFVRLRKRVRALISTMDAG